jgi:hypothetical protein
MREYAIGGGLIVLALGLLYGGLDLAGATGPPSIVTGQVTVANTATNPVPVQQQGTATVSVANDTVPVHEQGTADVVSADTTQVLLNEQIPSTGGGTAFTDTFDVSSAKEVAVFARALTCTASLTVQTGLFSTGAYLQDDFTNSGFGGGTQRVYPLPGKDFRVGVNSTCTVALAIVSRGN